MQTPLTCCDCRGRRLQFEYRRRGILDHAQAANGAHLALRPGDPATNMPVIVAGAECTVPEGSADYVIVDDTVSLFAGPVLRGVAGKLLTVSRVPLESIVTD